MPNIEEILLSILLGKTPTKRDFYSLSKDIQEALISKAPGHTVVLVENGIDYLVNIPKTITPLVHDTTLLPHKIS